MRGLTTLKPNSISHEKYNVKISNKGEVVDQKRGQFEAKPGQHLVIRVTPKVIDASDEVETYDYIVRNCKFEYEAMGLNFLRNYSKIGCEMECAIKDALEICKCLPWFYSNNFTVTPMCDIFGAKCFDEILSDETHYKKCGSSCLESCESTSFVAIPSYSPMNIEEICKTTPFSELFDKLRIVYHGINGFEAIAMGKWNTSTMDPYNNTYGTSIRRWLP